jgi:hypothetical protein
MVRFPLVLVASFVFTESLSAQPVKFGEACSAGDCFRVELSLTVAGKLKVQLPGGKVGEEQLDATANHAFVERVEAADTGVVTRAVRSYTKASATYVVSGGKQVRDLPANRRMIAIQQTADGPIHFHPEHPLTRDELELVSEHFDTLLLPRLLPDKHVTVGETWKVADGVARAVCLFDKLTTNELSGKLLSADKDAAEFAIDGTAEGTELGTAVKIAVKARGRFDLTAKRVVALTWEQTDDRGQGPASPAAELKATITLKRDPLAECPAELLAARKKVPDGKVSEAATLLRHADPAGKYSFLYPRTWHVTAQTGDHLVLRLIESGDWTAQATILSLKPAADGKHMTAAAFKDAIAKQPGWESAGVAADGELPTGPGRWLYRVTAAGKQDGLAVVQSFYCLADDAGNQVVVTVVARDDRAAKLAGRDLALVTAIEFPGKK